MQIVDHAPLAPGACYVTGRNDGPFLDTGLMIQDLTDYGQVYLAVSFLSDAIDVVGGLGPEAAEVLRARIRELEEENGRQSQAIEGLTAANEALVKAGYSPAATAPEPVTAGPDPRYTGMSDEEVLDEVLRREIDVPPDASREQMIEALGAPA